MTIDLNVGLAPSKKYPRRRPLTIRQVCDACYTAGLTVQRANEHVVEHDKATERTVALRVETPREWVITDVILLINALSVILSQECIAWKESEAFNGKLTGPYADEWGDFNPEFFISPLAKPAPQPVEQVPVTNCGAIPGRAVPYPVADLAKDTAGPSFP